MNNNEEVLHTARTLVEALPYMRKFAGRTFVVKYGGHAMGDAALADTFAKDIVLLKQVGINPIVVHGGGPQIKQMLDKLKIKSEFVDGLRVTDQATMEIVEMVLAGAINKQIVTAINRAGGSAIGVSGKDAELIRARKVTRTRKDPDSNIEQVLDLGFAGEPYKINPHILETLEKSDIIPVIAPVGMGEHGETFNINADTAAGAIAAEIKACKLMLLTDVQGILDKTGKLISRLSVADTVELQNDGTLSGGMIPKVETCVNALQKGVERAHILDGRVPHILLVETFTNHGVGTVIDL